jgi:hypothetical protein
MYVRGYLQGRENGRVATIDCCVVSEEATNINFIVWFDPIMVRTYDLPL